MNTTLLLGESWWRRQRGSLLKPQYLLPCGIAVGALMIDLATPRGVADGFLYVLAVLVCIWVPSVNAAVYTAIGVVPLMAVGFLASPAGAPTSVAVANVLVGTATVWVAAAVVWHNARVSREREALLTQIRNLQRTTIVAADNERAELSRWLHEGVGQELAAVGWGLDYIARRADHADEVRTAAQELRRAVDAAQHAIRGKAAGLRHPHVDQGGLRVLIERHASSFSTRTEIAVAIRGVECLERVSADHAEMCLRVVQESLTNVAKHSGARHVKIEFRSAAGTFHAIVTDDGRGISLADQAKPDSLGLLGLRERLTALGGALNVSNVEPHGVRIEARLPAPSAEIEAVPRPSSGRSRD